MGPQTAGGVAQVGRGWVGGRRGRRRGEKGGDRMRSRERHPHTEIHAEKWGEKRGRGRALEEQRRTEIQECMGDSVYTLRDRNIYTEMERQTWETECALSKYIQQLENSRVKAMLWGEAGARSSTSYWSLCVLYPLQHLDTREIRLNVSFEGSHENDKQERGCLKCGLPYPPGSGPRSLVYD